jgi:hypothetical protein
MKNGLQLRAMPATRGGDVMAQPDPQVNDLDRLRKENEWLRAELLQARSSLGVMAPLLTVEQYEQWTEQMRRLASDEGEHE